MEAVLGDRIYALDAWACDVPLPRPLRVGSLEVRSRKYCALRVSTSDGAFADVVVHTRGAPLDVVVADLVSPGVLSRSISEVTALREEFRARSVAMDHDGLVGRAWAAVDIALRGLDAELRGVPLWRRLGGTPRPLAILLVEGYYIEDESDEEFVERLSQRVAQGYKLLKLSISQGADSRALTRRVALLRRACPDVGIVIDCAWMFASARTAHEAFGELVECGLEWIEDPFPRDHIEAYRELAGLLPVPIGAGDEISRADDLVKLVANGGVRIPRIDAFAVGGVSAAIDAMHSTDECAPKVSFHEQPEVHQHIALTSRKAEHIECFPSDRPFDMRTKLLEQQDPACTTPGIWIPTNRAGLGMRLDIEQVRRYAYRHARTEA